MRTQLSQFCEHFVSTVQPLLVPLGKAIDVFTDEPDAHSGELQSELAELRDQVQALCDKVDGQRSYVLIFGPLKSGKSTLMNAIAESYVSEVSSLPAYPCLVFVSHGKREFLVADYEGHVETYTDPDALHERIDSAHQELAEHIRNAEDMGEQFDPQRHFPRALRRVDVKVPARNLETSGAVLVDTPGLYTRMRFGYDRMTREFRNAAACAIFVVKSDTLFLEQVFDEFNQLLELFSRVFLVVNMDTHKRDVGPDGKLVPSLEKSSPGRIIDAFESLAMPTPLKEAAADGRVQIYPVDLLNAASQTLQGKSVTQDFGKFRDDLHTYLASTEYLFAFLRDSMQRAQHLIDEADQLSRGTWTNELRNEQASAEEQRTAYQSELDQLVACRTMDWDPAFAPFTAELREELVRVSRDVGARVARDMSAAIETWFLSSHSLHWLLSTVWEPLVADYHRALDTAARRCLEQSIFQGDAGLQIPETVSYFLRAIDVDVTAVRQAAIQKLDSQGPQAPPAIPLDPDDIPVRRGILDVLTFRNEVKVRDRLFGPTEEPDIKIPARQKAARLGNPAKRYLNQFLLAFKDEFFKDTIKATEQRYGQKLGNLTTNQLHKQLQDREPDLQKKIELLELQAQSLQRILQPLDQMSTVGEEVRSRVHALDTQFAATDIDVLLEPQPPQQPPESSHQRRTADSSDRRRR